MAFFRREPDVKGAALVRFSYSRGSTYVSRRELLAHLI